MRDESPPQAVRAAVGRYEFRGPARLYFDPRFGPMEHYLLEVHEHNHWQLTHSTIFGLSQLSLAYALLLARNEHQRRRYAECLEITSRLSREVCKLPSPARLPAFGK